MARADSLPSHRSWYDDGFFLARVEDRWDHMYDADVGTEHMGLPNAHVTTWRLLLKMRRWLRRAVQRIRYSRIAHAVVTDIRRLQFPY